MSKRLCKSLIHIAVVHALIAPLSIVATLSQVYAANTPQADATERLATTENLRRTLIELKNAVIESPEDPELRFRLGRLYLDLGDPRAAEKELTRADALGLDSYDLRLALGEAWIQQGDFTRLFTDYDLLQTKTATEKAGLLTLQGNAYLVQGKLRDALGRFESALAEKADFVPALIGVIETKLQEGDLGAAELALANVRQSPDVDPVDLLRLRANLAFKHDRYQEALTDYREAIAQRGGDPVLLRGLAVTQLRLGDWKQATETLDRLLALNPNSGDAIALKAQAALRMKDYETAAQLAGAVVGVGDDERQLSPLYIAGVASLFNGAPQQAREYLSRYLVQRPDDANARRLLGQALLQLDNPAEAYEVLKPLADGADDDVALLSALALAAAGGGAADDAVRYLEQAVELEPENTGLQAQLAAARVATADRTQGLDQLEQLAARNDGYALLSLDAALNRLTYGELDAAISTAAKVQEMAPDAPGPKLVQAIALLQGGQLDAAEAAFAKVLEQQPDNVASRTGMAEIGLRRGNTEQALAQFEKLVADNPRDITLGLNLAAAELGAGRRPQAERRLEEIVAKNPNSTVARVALAKVYLIDPLPDRALAVLREADNPDDLDVLTTSAVAEMIAERPDNAIAKLEQAAAANPSSVNTQLLLAEAYRRNEQYAESLSASEAAVKIAPNNPATRFERLRQTLTSSNATAEELTAAIAGVKEYASLYPADPRSPLLRGLSLYRMKGQREEALAMLTAAYRSWASIDSTLLLAEALSFADKQEDAAEILGVWVDRHPGDNHARLRLAQTRIAIGEFDAAANDLVAAIEQGARRPGLAMMAAWTLAHAGRSSEARAFLRQAEAEGAPAPLVEHTRGLMRLDGGDAAGAAQSLKRAMDAYGKATPPRLALDYAKALSSVGEGAAARRTLNALLGNESATEREREEAKKMLLDLSGS